MNDSKFSLDPLVALLLEIDDNDPQLSRIARALAILANLDNKRAEQNVILAERIEQLEFRVDELTLQSTLHSSDE